jgi:hypothetical protein
MWAAWSAASVAAVGSATDVDDRVGLSGLPRACDHHDGKRVGRTFTMRVIAGNVHDAAFQARQHIADVGQISTGRRLKVRNPAGVRR